MALPLPTELNVSRAIIATTFCLFFYLWLFTDAGWLHTELLSISDFLWLSDRSNSIIRQLLTVFDWQMFESSPFRLRTVSDLTEVIDAIARPALSWMTGLRPSVSLTALPMSIATVVAFYMAVRCIGIRKSAALLFAAVFISTIGFQSCYIAYIRPAKRLALLGLCLTMLFALRSIKRADAKDPWWLLATLQLSFLADESGFVFYPIAMLVLLAGAVDRGDAGAPARRALIIIAPLPLLHILLAYMVLPQMYGLIGANGPRDQILGAGLVGQVLSGLVDPIFYNIFAENLVSEILATFGVVQARPRYLIALGLGLGLAVIYWRHRRVTNTQTGQERTRSLFLLIATVLIVVGLVGFLTLIDRYNWPKEPNYLGSLTYYYHSVVSAAGLFALAAALKFFGERSSIDKIPVRAPIAAIGAVLSLFVVVSNFLNFIDVNRVVQRMHIYQLEPAVIDTLRNAILARSDKISIEIHPRRAATEFVKLARDVVGSRSEPFERVFNNYIEHPMGTEPYLQRLVRAFYPKRNISIKFDERD